MAVLALVAAACGDDSAGPTTTAGSPTPTTAAPTSAPSNDSSTTIASVGDGGAVFAMTSVTLSASGRAVLIQNVGSSSGNLSGFALCQAPAYHTFGDIELGPGEFIAVSLGGDDFVAPAGAKETVTANVGRIDAEDGELGLYSKREFSNSDAIVDYVEWGSTGHRRSGVAVEAGIWSSGDFVATTADSVELSAQITPSAGAGDWVVG